ncbi:Prp 4, partial [Dactylonectria estremocensis]
LSALVFVGLASASVPRTAEQSTAFLVLERYLGGVVERQADTCEGFYGEGWNNCGEYSCYNPSIHVCCSNGSHCPRGTYCATNANCCPKGMSLEECSATGTLGTIPPPSGTKEPSTSTSRLQAPTAPASSGTITTPLPPHATVAGAGKHAEVGVLAAIGGLGVLLMAV